MLRAFVDPRIQTLAPHQSSRPLNGTREYLPSHFPRPADGAHNQSDPVLPTTAPQGSCPCSSCVEQTMIHLLDQTHRQNHLPVDQKVL